MRPPKTDRHRQVYLEPGELFCSRRPAVVQTVLGSCIAVTMHAARLQCGAICHALLPNGGHSVGEQVDQAIRTIYLKMLALGAQHDELEVKLFGGSTVLSAPTAEEIVRPPIGDQNVAQALRLIELLGLTLTARDTGGDTGRKVIFYTDNGEVYVRKQRSSPARRVAAAMLQNPEQTTTCRR